MFNGPFIPAPPVIVKAPVVLLIDGRDETVSDMFTPAYPVIKPYALNGPLLI